METEKEIKDRLESMASGSSTWDLSDNDIAAIKWALKTIEENDSSHNSKSTPCPECGGFNTHVEGYHCLDCNIPWLA